jgi:hypothetical protein
LTTPSAPPAATDVRRASFLLTIGLVVTACKGPILDLGPHGDVNCSEIANGGDLTRVDFGHGSGAECVRFFAITAAEVNDIMDRIEKDVRSLCSFLANAGGLSTTDLEAPERCAVAASAILTTKPYTDLAPISIFESAPEICTLNSDGLTCSACKCDENASAVVRGPCALPETDWKVKKDSTPSDEVRGALRDSLPVFDQVTDASLSTTRTTHWKDVLATIEKLRQDADDAKGATPFDERQVNCIENSKKLFDSAADHLRNARAAAQIALDAFPPNAGR